MQTRSGTWLGYAGDAPREVTVRKCSIRVASLLVFVALAGSLHARAAILPTGFTETLIASGLSNPTAMAFAPDGRLLVCLQGGELRVVKNGAPANAISDRHGQFER
jgi:glucose/arabinose dehydrogenase